MNWEVNQKVNKKGSYRELERDLKKYAEDKNNKVYLRVELKYTKDSRRPSAFKYKYIVEGTTHKTVTDTIINTKTPRTRSNKSGK